MTFAFVAKHRHIWPVRWMCDVLGVSRSGFHAWLKRPISNRAAQDAKLVSAIDKSFRASDRTYGARRVWRDVLEDGLDRDFEADRPNQKWLADFTYIWTAQGWLYVAVVLDLFSRCVVGWSMKGDRDASLVMAH